MDRIAEINRRNRRNAGDVIREQNERAHRFNDSEIGRGLQHGID